MTRTPHQTHHTWRRLLTIVTAGILAATLAACSGGIRDLTTIGAKDAAGMTRGEVEDLGLEGRYNLVGERYLRIQELMTEAQLVVSDEEWSWQTPGFEPTGGSTAYDSLSGGTRNNSHFMRMARATHPEGAVGEVADARPVYDYFVSKGWEVSITENDFSELELEANRDFRVKAITEDGYRMEYTVQQNGQYNMEVLTDTFWGDADEIKKEQVYRFAPGKSLFPGGLPPELSTESGQSVPGVYTEYPKWSDPLLRSDD